MPNIDLYDLPDELLEHIISYLPPADLAAASATSKRLLKIANEPLLWRYHCEQTWKHWEEAEKFRSELRAPVVEIQWKEKFLQRAKRDRWISSTLNALLETQQGRIARMQDIADLGYDAKDILLEGCNTPATAEDVLARRYHSEAILGLMNRKRALEIWRGLHTDPYFPLEEALGAYDLFVLGSRSGDINDISAGLDTIAQRILAEYPDYDTLSLAQKAESIATYLRAQGIVGNTGTSAEEFHALRNNYIGLALLQEPHKSLPLQSVAIYCAVARRLNLNAWITKFPFHIHAVVLPGPPSDLANYTETTPIPNESVHMDVWRRSAPADLDEMHSTLRATGIANDLHDQYLGPATTREMVMRTGRNIMRSVEEAREHRDNPVPADLDVDAAFYSFLWSMLLAGSAADREINIHRRRNYLPYLLEQFQAHFPEDVGLVSRYVVRMFEGHPQRGQLVQLLEELAAEDRNAKPVRRRLGTVGEAAGEGAVKYKVGQLFQHKRYGYEGVVVGWDPKCEAGEMWMQQMSVDRLPRGRGQSFYHIL